MPSAPDEPMAHTPTPRLSSGAVFNLLVIGLTAFLTVVDLFATQAILPSLAKHYDVAPSAMGVAVNATTIGMAFSGLAVALFGQKINRRLGVLLSLGMLAIPTALLAFAANLTEFTILRVVQGVFMAVAFTLTLAHLGERCPASASPAAFAAYVTGNVASNLVGRIVAAGLVGHFGLATNFYVFAALNLAGAVLVAFTMSRAAPQADLMRAQTSAPPWAAVAGHLANPALRTSFAIGFLILFAFIGAFTYVNFVLVRTPYSLAMMTLGLVYLVFLPSIFTTPLAGRVVACFGARVALVLGFAIALAGLPLLLSPALASVLAGLVLVGIGTFLAQATATGFVSRTAQGDRAAASGLYLASYFLGGLAGSAVLGAAFDHAGWVGCVIGIGAALAIAAVLALRLRAPILAAV